MKTCKTCTHWHQREHYETIGLRDKQQLGDCVAAHQLFDSFEYVRKPNGTAQYELKKELVGVLAFVEDASSYHAQLVTRSNFGCRMHNKNIRQREDYNAIIERA